MNPIRVLIVDDSGLMRLFVADILSQTPDIVVIDSACNGLEAYQKTFAQKPDVVVLDMVMPKYDGKYAIEKIMTYCPTPIIILSGLGNQKPLEIEEAIQMGALDFVNKPNSLLSPDLSEIRENLSNKIRNAVGMTPQTYRLTHQPKISFQRKSSYQVLLLGASTGGTVAIESILSKFPHNFPLTVVLAQHLPKGNYVHKFAERLQSVSALPVSLAKKLDKLETAHVYLMPPEQELFLFENEKKDVFFDFRSHKQESLSIDHVFKTFVQVFEQKTIGILLSGMGKDGAEGIKNIYWAGGLTIAQDQKSSLIYSMPLSAIESGTVQHILSVQHIPDFLIKII